MMASDSAAKPVVFLTGGSRGIGLATASQLLGRGAHVVTLSRSSTAELKALADRYPDSLHPSQGDVTDNAAVVALIAQIIAKFKRLDAVVLNAGVGVIGDVATGALADWQTQFNVGVFSAVSALHAAIPHLRSSPNGGRIIFVSSGLSTSPLPSGAAYAAAKAAVNSIARSLKIEEPSITTMSVHPGIVDTEILRELINSPEKVHPYTHKFFSDSLNGIGKHACVPAEEPASIFAWLALHAPQELSGQFLRYSDDAIQRAMGTGTVIEPA